MNVSSRNDMIGQSYHFCTWTKAARTGVATECGCVNS